jgi:DNA repair protein RadC
VFAALFLDTRHRVIAFEELFQARWMVPKYIRAGRAPRVDAPPR